MAHRRAPTTDTHGNIVLPPSMRDRVPFLLYRAAESSHALANQMLSGLGLTARQVGILTIVSEVEPMTQKALGEALRIDRTSMVALLDDLEVRGYVVRRKHPSDRRAFLIHPTAEGKDAKVAAIQVLDEQQELFMAALTDDERRTLGELLMRLAVQSQHQMKNDL